MSDKIRNYNPSAPRQKGTLFGLPHGQEEADVVIYPVPWEATVSYNSGTSYGPPAILEASTHIGLEIAGQEAPWKRGIWMSPMNGKTKAKSDLLRSQIEPYIAYLEGGKALDDVGEILEKANGATASLRKKVHTGTKELLDVGKKVGLLGGDHSTALGLIDALAEKYEDFGILQIDAQMDLREAYEGFELSHASVMFNVLKMPQVTKLVQVAIRDFYEEETRKVEAEGGRVTVFYDQHIQVRMLEGKLWKQICDEIIDQLPNRVYISVDIDGLEPSLCPGTGTPVPGGLTFDQTTYLLWRLKGSGKQIIGFDLCEVAPKASDQEWNANVGARLLYHLCGVIS